MSIDQYLLQLSLKDPDDRRLALESILEAEGFSHIRQEEAPSYKTPRGVANYLLTPWNKEPGPLFCAHYDAVSGSFGANDNAAALCILIELAKTLRKENHPARFAFFDGEETGNAGSRLCVSSMD